MSALNTLWDLKLRILEALSVHPRNADVYCLAHSKWTKLDNDEASLAGTRPASVACGVVLPVGKYACSDVGPAQPFI